MAIEMEELLDTKQASAQATSREWPEAPDLQLECLSSDSDSDDSSIEVVGVVNHTNPTLNNGEVSRGQPHVQLLPAERFEATAAASNRNAHRMDVPSCRFSQNQNAPGGGVNHLQNLTWERNVAGPAPLAQAGPSFDSNNASFPDCYVANPSNGALSPPLPGPCPHAHNHHHHHGYIPVPHQLFFPPPNISNPANTSTPVAGFAIGQSPNGGPPPQPALLNLPIPFNLGPPQLQSHPHPHQHQHHPHFPTSLQQISPVHSHGYPPYLDPRMHPNQQRLWLTQQRMQELNRQRLYQNPRQNAGHAVHQQR